MESRGESESDSKRGSEESGCESQHGPRKRVKMRDLDSVCRSDVMNSQLHYSSRNNKDGAEFQFEESDESQVTKVTARLDSNAVRAEKTGKNAFQSVINAASRPLDLNAEVFQKDKVSDDRQECFKSSDKREMNSDFGISRGIGLDLNSEDVSSTMNQDPFFPYKDLDQLKPRDISECASSTGPLEENDPLRVWKQMKENGFLSSSHGGIPIPKQRVKKTKTDVLKKKMEIAKREQVDRFTKIAAPSGLLNELNPGIINHVRNRKQVHSIIEALVRSEKQESGHIGSKQMSHNDSGLHSSSHEDRQPKTNSTSWVRGFPASLVRCHSILEAKGVESDHQATAERLSLKSSLSQSTVTDGDDALALKLSSSAKMSENESPLSNEDPAMFLSIKAATIASQWLELLHQDIKGRLAALRRSKKRVRAVICTELPFLLSKEFAFAYDQENDPLATTKASTAEIHRARWSRLFDQMDKSLSEEEKQLDCWLNQVKEMQLHCEQGLHHVHANTTAFGFQQYDFRSQRLDIPDREMAVRAAAASIYSTCNFILTENNNVSCF